MRTRTVILTLAIALSGGLITINAADKPAHKHAGGPKGGRLLECGPPHAEFLVEKDRSVTVSFYDEKLKPVAVNGQSVIVYAEAKSGKARLTFSGKGGALRSTKPLPAGDGYQVVVLVKATAGGKSENFRFEFHDEKCEECKRVEYACICDSHDHKDHKKK